jgi:hypothetical protein
MVLALKCDVHYAFAYACSYDASMGHYKWYLVPCNDLSRDVQTCFHGLDFKLSFATSTHSELRDASEKGQEGTQWQGFLKTSQKEACCCARKGLGRLPICSFR